MYYAPMRYNKEGFYWYTNKHSILFLVKYKIYLTGRPTNRILNCFFLYRWNKGNDLQIKEYASANINDLLSFSDSIIINVYYHSTRLSKPTTHWSTIFAKY